MIKPVDATTTPAWSALTALHESLDPDLRAWFAEDPGRAERFSYEVGDLFVDLSKNFLTDEVRDGIVNHSGDRRAYTLEGRVVHVADRIAYLCHDYDDSLRAGLLRPEDLPAEVKERIGVVHSDMITALVSDVIAQSDRPGPNGQRDIRLTPEIQEAMDSFRTFMFVHIYHSKALARERAQAVFVLEQLFHHFRTHFDQLPAEFIAREERWGQQQVVVDYVAGLTDSYAVQLFTETFIPPVGFVPRGAAHRCR